MEKWKKTEFRNENRAEGRQILKKNQTKGEKQKALTGKVCKRFHKDRKMSETEQKARETYI